jgi:hypothetical protein
MLALPHSDQNVVYGVDPGTTHTGWVLWDGKTVIDGGSETPNEEFLERLRGTTDNIGIPMYIEMIASYGMAVGKETFQTCVWIGRFVEVWSILGYPWQFCYRTQIRTHHCHDARAGDSNVNAALRDKYGGKGTKKNPGPLFKVSKHMWSAVAVATYALETKLPCSSQVG